MPLNVVTRPPEGEKAAIPIVPAFGSGWIVYTGWTNGTGNPISSFRTTWVVPPFPMTQSGQLLFLFNGIQNSSMIYQPVLQWGVSAAGGGNYWAVAAGGGNYWAVASWYADGQGGPAFHSTLVKVNPGDTLVGVMTLSSHSGSNFSYNCDFQGIANTGLPIQNVQELTWAVETLECYGITQCTDYPPVFGTAMTAIAMQTGSVTPAVTWTPNNAHTECGQHVVVVSNSATKGEVDLDYGLMSPRVPGLAQVDSVSRSKDKLDIFATDNGGVILTAAWEPDFADGWHGWWNINGGRAAAGAPVHGVSRSTDHLDVFVTGTDNYVYTAAWQPSFTDGWHGWWRINNGIATPGAHVTAVSRSTDHLDIFVVGTDGRVYTAAWEPDFTDGWHGWWPIGNIRVPAGAPIYAVSRSTNKLDIFCTDVNGVIQTAAWEPDFTDGWHGWWQIQGGRAAPGASVTAVSRSTDHLDIFVVGTDGRVYTAAWEPDFTSWHGWWPIGAIHVPAGAAVHCVSRSTNKLDIFCTDTSGNTQTAAWEPDFTDGWHGWWVIQSGRAAAGAPITAVSRSTDHLDVFVVGTDSRVYTAAWEPDFTSWHGWWALGR
ncbi:MAG TPA: hypothetical protein VE959_36365 [Bryobacteraceae bacterium]|nr:hypothetical protein [Bryobacteraceae bacterium]